MKIFLISIAVVSSILMIIVILLQQGKGADLGAAFGRGAQGGLVSSSGKANFLTRITSGLAVVFLVSSLALSIFLGDSQQDGVLQQLQNENLAGEIPAAEQDTLSEESTVEVQGDSLVIEGDDSPETPD